MKIKAWVRSVLCADCIPEDGQVIDAHPALVTMNHTADAIDRLTDEVRGIRREMASGYNPMLGRHPKVGGAERRRHR